VRFHCWFVVVRFFLGVFSLSVVFRVWRSGTPRWPPLLVVGLAVRGFFCGGVATGSLASMFFLEQLSCFSVFLFSGSSAASFFLFDF